MNDFNRFVERIDTGLSRIKLMNKHTVLWQTSHNNKDEYITNLSNAKKTEQNINRKLIRSRSSNIYRLFSIWKRFDAHIRTWSKNFPFCGFKGFNVVAHDIIKSILYRRWWILDTNWWYLYWLLVFLLVVVENAYKKLYIFSIWSIL